MSCCDNDDDGHWHDYCCRCCESESERAQRIIEDILDGTYGGEVEIEWPPGQERLAFCDASQVAEAIIAVLKHEDVI